MHEVEEWEKLINAGDYMFCKRSDGTEFPIIVCPRCLKGGSCSGHTLVQRSPLTIRASFLCSQPHEGKTCGWHGMITDGVMEGDEC